MDDLREQGCSLPRDRIIVSHSEARRVMAPSPAPGLPAVE